MDTSGDGTDPHGVTTWAVIIETSPANLGGQAKVLAEVQGSREDALAELLRQTKPYRRRNRPLYRDGDRYLVSGSPGDIGSPAFVFKLWERVHLDE